MGTYKPVKMWPFMRISDNNPDKKNVDLAMHSNNSKKARQTSIFVYFFTYEYIDPMCFVMYIFYFREHPRVVLLHTLIGSHSLLLTTSVIDATSFSVLVLFTCFLLFSSVKNVSEIITNVNDTYKHFDDEWIDRVVFGNIETGRCNKNHEIWFITLLVLCYQFLNAAFYFSWASLIVQNF
jgi:hypothetical protein